ncbi:MAG: hypothetical protein KA146_09735 [Leptospiraceae bacterium]|nr:hypothetical protein [Leptospiraceae bacterium]
MKTLIDFSKWPENIYAPAIFTLNRKQNKKLEHFPVTKKHIECLLSFLWHCSVQDQELLMHYREGYLRAALMEFSLLEDSLNDEYPSNSFKFIGGDEPIFHLLKMLRNTQLHLRNISLEEMEFEYIWGKDEDGNPRTWQGKIHISQDLHISDLSKWKGLKYYEEEQVIKILNWFNKEQKSFGIQNLIYQGMNRFIEILP